MTTATDSRLHPRSAGSRRRLSGALSAILVAVLAGGLATAGVASADGADGIESVPVSFSVQVPDLITQGCLGTSVAGPATLRGTLTGPKKALEGGAVAGSVLTHGDGYDESFYTFPEKGYNVVEDLAKRGHISVSYDRLGYGDSDKPNGNGVCYATEAAVLKQVIDQLRAGTYQATWESKPKFTRVASLGHSAGGFVIENEAATFGGIDALGAISTGLEAATPRTVQRAAEQQLRCKVTGPAPNGYAGLEANDAQFREDHLNVGIEPRIADILTKNRTKDACAGTLNLQAVVQNTLTNITRVNVPVLAVAGANDQFFPGVQLHAATFTASPEVTVKQIPQTPHAIAFSGQRQLFRDTVAAWLAENGF